MRSFDTNIHILTYTNIHTICPMHETVAEGRTLIKDLFCLGVKSGRRRITSNILGIESVLKFYLIFFAWCDRKNLKPKLCYDRKWRHLVSNLFLKSFRWLVWHDVPVSVRCADSTRTWMLGSSHRPSLPALKSPGLLPDLLSSTGFYNSRQPVFLPRFFACSAALVAISNTSLTPSFVLAEHSK